MRAVLWPDATVRTPRSASRSPNWVWIVSGAVLLIACLAVAGTATLGSALALPYLFGRATATPSPQPTLGAVLFEDHFSDTSGGWEVGADNGSQRLFDQEQFVIQVTKSNWQAWSPATEPDLTNLHAEVTISSTGFATDAGFGLLCDYTDTTHYYFLGITADGYYAIFKKEADTETILSDPNGKWVQSMHFARNAASYRVGADCGADGRLALTVDGSQVAAVNDSTYSSGQIGLFVRTFDKAPAEVRFDDLIVTALN
jgi:hypothetical protein